MKYEDFESIEELYNYIYDYSESVDFDYYKTEEICRQLRAKSFFSNLKWYIRDKYNFEYIFDPKVREIVEKINNKRKQSKIEADKIKNFNPALLKNGIKYKGSWRNEEEKIIVLKYVLEYYDKYTYKARNMLMQEFNTSYETINKMYSEAIDIFILKGDKSNKAEVLGQRMAKANFDKKMDTSDKFKAYEKLLVLEDEDEIEQLIDSLNLDVSKFKNGVSTFANNYAGNTTLIYNIINSKIDIYIKVKSIKRREIRKLEKDQERLLLLQEAIEIIKKFTECDSITIKEFCKKYEISENDFNKYISLVKEYDEELTKKYEEKILDNSKKSFAILVSKVEEIIKKIKNGIEVNDEIRSFDVIDYYISTKLDFSKLLEIAKKILNPQDFALIKRFVAQNKIAEKQDYKFAKNILESTTIINVQKDEKGNLIPGSGEIVSIEVKQGILNFLKRFNIPINQKTYNIAFKKYLNNEILLSEDEELTLKRENPKA